MLNQRRRIRTRNSEKVTTAVKDVMEGIEQVDWKEVTKSINDGLERVDWKEGTKSVNDGIEKVDWKEVRQTLKECFE